MDNCVEVNVLRCCVDDDCFNPREGEMDDIARDDVVCCEYDDDLDDVWDDNVNKFTVDDVFGDDDRCLDLERGSGDNLRFDRVFIIKGE